MVQNCLHEDTERRSRASPPKTFAAKAMRRPGFALALLIAAAAAAGMLFYERQLIELRSELEEARLREAQAASALNRISEVRRAEVRAARAEAEDAQRRAQEAAQQARAAADRARADAERAATKARAQAERASASAQAAALRAREESELQGPRFYREPYRPSQPHAAPSRSNPGGAGLFSQAQALEGEGKNAEAVRIYIRAARTGSGAAAKRLAQIYEKGIDGVPPDKAEMLKWRNVEQVLGEDTRNPRSPDERRAEDEARRAQDEARRAAEGTGRAAKEAASSLYEKGVALEKEGRSAEAIRFYIRAARGGSSPAVERLLRIYDRTDEAPSRLYLPPGPNYAPKPRAGP